ncbi:hypothetical protein ACIO3O_07700 [Streptomyces sp. NPDC087440]|uniref:hypothetical protein n=1 Tax=Streptomyces sp. NPDC087440 TaxID=3365790 RepID=UPI0038259899
MFLHAIPPVRAFTKVSNALLAHPRLGADAKVLIAYIQSVQGHTPLTWHKPLSAYAAELGMKPGRFRAAKKELVENGFVHDLPDRNAKGQRITRQWVSNVPLSEDAVHRLDELSKQGASPSAPEPAAGEPGDSPVGGVTETKTTTKTKTNPTLPPSEPVGAGTAPADAAPEPEESEPDPAPEKPDEPDEPEYDVLQLAAAERVLRELKTARNDLYLGARDAHALAPHAALWLARGESLSTLWRELTVSLPNRLVENAHGFVRDRLLRKAPPVPELGARPQPQPQPVEPAPRPRPLVDCGAPGCGKVFRPVGGETYCGPCRIEHPEFARVCEAMSERPWAPLPHAGPAV